jgi:hypothetical protein
MNRVRFALAALVILLTGCQDNDRVTAVSDVTPPAAPRGLFSVTGDGRVSLEWLGNTEGDLAGYKIYTSPCASGPGCPYDFVMSTTGNTAVITGLVNGTTRFFAVAAYDRTGNESELSYEDVFDTPRPAGFALTLGEASAEPAIAGWDFSAFGTPAFRLPFDGADTDVFHGVSAGVHYMYAPYVDTDIQDAGYALSLDAVDFAPQAGWAADGVVQLIPGHNYVVWTHDNHFAKFRVVSLSDSPSRVTLDWAYQIATGNPELAARRPRAEGARVRRTFGPAS